MVGGGGNLERRECWEVGGTEGGGVAGVCRGGWATWRGGNDGKRGEGGNLEMRN